MSNESKNNKIKETQKATKERRKGMVCRVFELKIIKNKLNKAKLGHLNSLYREAKWLRNAVIGSDDIFGFDRDAKSVLVKVGDAFEERSFEVLGSQMKQDIVDGVKTDIGNLSKSKTAGNKVGALKFKSFVNMIPLRQFGTTYRIDFDNNTITIQCLKSPLKVRGLKQIPENSEFACAKLIRKPSGYYIHVTTYCEKENDVADTAIGIDFGIKDNITISDGRKRNICVPELKAVKLAARRMNRNYSRHKNKKSSNHRKRVHRLRIAYEKQNNIKADLSNKLVSELLDNAHIAIQDEMIKNWHSGWFGKSIQYSAMGSIKAKLQTSSKTHTVKRSYPSTQICPQCGNNTKHPLGKRDYDCAHCGYHHPDRDFKSAEVILIASFDPTNLVKKKSTA